MNFRLKDYYQTGDEHTLELTDDQLMTLREILHECMNNNENFSRDERVVASDILYTLGEETPFIVR